MIEQTVFKISLWTYLGVIACLAAVDVIGIVVGDHPVGYPAHLIVVLGFCAVFMPLYGVKIAPRVPRIVSILVAVAHLLTCIFPLATLSPILLLLGPVGQVLNFLSMPVLLIFLVSGFLLALGTNHPSSAPPHQHHPAPVPHRVPVAPVGQGTPYGTGAPLPNWYDQWMRTVGSPGAGLADSGFGDDQISLGVRGEKATAEILSRVQARHPTTVVGHSLRVHRDTEADLDHLLVVGNHLVIIDSKMWRSNRRYMLTHDSFDNADVISVGRPDGDYDDDRHTAMPWMLEQMRQAFPGYFISGLICIHGTSEAAMRSQSIGVGSPSTANLSLILAGDLESRLDDLASQAETMPTDSAVLTHLNRLRK